MMFHLRHSARLVLAIGLPLVLVSLARAAEPATELLWPAGAPGALGTEDKDKPKLILHPAGENATGAAIVVCPGGGYGGLAMDHEGKQIAAWLNSLGVHAFILDYRHRGKGYGHPAPLQDAQRAIRLVRSHAKDWNVNPQQVGILGFSAGGHLTSSAGTHFDAGQPDAKDPIDQLGCRPDFLILCYPVISFVDAATHTGSRRNLLGGDADEALIKSMSSELQVTKETPPTFLWHTSEDKGVPPRNSILFYEALHAAGVPAEMHIYAKGQHGVGLAKTIPGTSDWSLRCAEWMNSLGLLSKPKQ